MAKKRKLSALGFILKKLCILALAKFATKEELSGAALYPVDISTLTPSSTFAKNNVIGINGVLYRAKVATSNLPITLVVQDGAFVTHTVNGVKAFVVSSFTLNSDWEVWMDAGMAYAYSSADARLSALENTTVPRLASRITVLENIPTSVTYGGKKYTAAQLFAEMAKLMEKTVVTQ